VTVTDVSGHQFLSAEQLPAEGLAVLTQWVQRYLWEHQHCLEEGCATASYLSSEWNAGGLGLQAHVAGAALAKAVKEGRIFIWNKIAGKDYVHKPMCSDVTNWLCYLRAPTNCTLELYANSGNTLIHRGDLLADVLPKEVKAMISKFAPHMKTDKIKYWWHAQSTAYVMRFNDRTVHTLAKMRRSERMLKLGKKGNHQMVEVLQGMPTFPMPPGTISAHVRHGDKRKEMALVPFDVYVKKAEEIVQLLPLAIRRVLFVLTEDPEVIKGVDELQNWVAMYSDIPQENLNGKLQMHLDDDVTLLHLLQLLMTLECDAWVGTQESNWNCLIDELQCVWVAKCMYPYLEAGRERSYNWK